MWMVTNTPYDGSLSDWEDVKDRHAWDALVLGNGLSINVWGSFEYESLYHEATTHHLLTSEDTDLFARLGATNFESVLHALSESIRVGHALGEDRATETARHASVRAALARAVQSVHIPGGDVPAETLQTISDEIGAFRHVFTTSYNLILYWAVAHAGFQGYPDFFWDGPRKDAFAEETIWLRKAASVSRLYFLHGALHLVVLRDGTTCKRKSTAFHNLLQQFGTAYGSDPSARPLIVTEARASDKRVAIAENSYLTYCWRQLEECDAPLVVFGHSLGDQDVHLVEAINEFPDRPVAFGMRKKNQRKNRREQHRICSRLDARDISFFDSTTHPLGSKDLTIAENPFIKLLRKRRAAA